MSGGGDDGRRAYVLERIRGVRRRSPEPAEAALAAGAAAPLSFGQERLWFLERLAPGTGLLNESYVLRLRGRLDRDALERALAAIVRRHGILRTSFVEHDGRPEQVEHAEVTVALRRVDLSPTPAAEREAALERQAREIAAKPFGLDRAPLMRAVLFELAEADAALLIVNHHIVCDGWSRQILVRELAEFYRAELAGEAATLPALPARYADFVRRQRARAADPAFADGLRYWAEQLRGAEPIELPEDFARPATARHEGERIELLLAPELRAAVDAFAQRAGVTPFVVMLAAFVAMLHRQSGQRDITIGVPVANRDAAGAEQVIGFFANSVALRFRLRPGMTLRDLVAQARETTVAGFARADIPFERVVQQVEAARDVSRAPVYQVMLAPQPEIGAVTLAGGVACDARVVDAGVARLDLSVDVIPRGRGYALSLEYDTGLFARATAERMLGRLELALAAVSRDADLPLDELDVLGRAERESLERWNRSDAEVPDETVAAQFARQVRATPDAVALQCGDAEVTWEQLRERADRLARRLAALGVGPESRVGICLDRGIDMVVAMVGILAAGAAYVPLDLDYPAPRIAFILDDAKLERIVTTRHLVGGLLRDHADRLCPIDADGAPEAEPRAAGPANAAYAIYTSGSTGTPKGVVVEHRNVVNFFAGMDRVLGRPQGAWLAMTSIAFDISVLELLWTLCRGVKVVLPPPEHETLRKPSRRRAATQFSLFFFSDDVDAEPQDRYRLVMQSARFADENGLAAVWVPERHFHAFGGLYPNPAVMAAALAATTRQVAIRAGSVVLPLHHPLRVAEEWAVIDNLSKGRAGVAFASGWHADDFVFAPDAFADRFETMLDAIRQVKRLWAGEPVRVRNGAGHDVDVRAFPPPYRGEPPIWLTSSHSPRTFEAAGRLGANVLTHLLGQTFDELEEKIALYRAARRTGGHAGDGIVTLMLHTYVAESADAVEHVREPMRRYLAASLDLVGKLALSLGHRETVERLGPADREAVLDLAFERYVRGHSLLGTLAECAEVVQRSRAAGVDEIACLIDFGLPTETVLAALPLLRELAGRAAAAPDGDAEDVVAAAVARGVTHLQVTPSVARAIAATPSGRAALRGLTALVVGGEALAPELAARLRALVPTVLNVYGPTETTVWSTAHTVGAADDAAVPIGHPLANTRAYVLDANRRPVPIGTRGELWIGGHGVSRGYLDRPELDAARYAADPFSPQPGARMYRTGDVVRRNHAGELLFLGREDGQVKLRGFRIELGEVEHLAAQHPGVRACAARVWDVEGDARLVVYAVGRFGGAPSTAELRHFILDRAPAYLAPNYVVPLQALPLTPNGKVDRAALPPPTQQRGEQRDRVAPSTPVELALAELWKTTLALDDASIHDDFFDVGGHSLLAVQLVDRCRTAFASRVPLAHFIAHPTIAGLADYLEAEGCRLPVRG